MNHLHEQYGSDLAASRSDLARSLMDTQCLGIALFDGRQHLLFINQWLAGWVGLAEEEAIGKPVTRLFPGLIASEILAVLERVCGGGKGVYWLRDVDPERLDMVENAMTRGDREQPLYSVSMRPVSVAGIGSCALLEVMEAPYNPASRQPPVSPGTADSGTGVRYRNAALLRSERFGLITVDHYGFIQEANDCLARMTGYSADSLAEKPLRILFPDLYSDDAEESCRQIIEFRQRQHPEGLLEAVSAEGQLLMMDVSLFEHAADPRSLVLLCRDQSRAEQTRAALLQQRELLSAVYGQVADAIVLLDRRGFIEHINPVGLEMLGLSNIGNGEAHVDATLRLLNESQQPVHPFQLMLKRQRTVGTGDNVKLMVAGREPLAVNLTAVPLRDGENRIIGSVIVMRAISESRRISSQLSWQATHDPLTQLPNRRQIESDILRAIEAARADDSTHMLLYLDLYNFSVVNDTCGHSAGDELLRRFATLISRQVGTNDVVARIGNDEFAVLLWNRTPEAASEETEQLLWQIKEYSFPWEERRLKVGASIGTKVIDRHAVSEIDVLVAAGTSCAAARESGRNRIHFHYQGQEIRNRHSLAKWTARISEALEQERFVVFCQPIVSLGGEQTVRHYEALVRMLDPEGNIVPPGKFIPAAEKSGLVDEIDRWVLEGILSSLERVSREQRSGLRFSVNLSGHTISDDRFKEYLLDRLRHSAVDPAQIQFEITETAAVRHFDRAMGFINAFKDMGCYFSLDDFGSGLSSFGYLKSLPVDYLKIDGSFVRNMELNDVDRSMVSTINHLAHIMGISTIAESVENQTQLSMLEEMGVDYAQGYHICAPASIDSILS